jgi:hypothetical protein
MIVSRTISPSYPLLEDRNFSPCYLPTINKFFKAGYAGIYGLCAFAACKESVIYIGACDDLLKTMADKILQPAIARFKPTYFVVKSRPAKSAEQRAARAAETERFREKYKPLVRD